MAGTISHIDVEVRPSIGFQTVGFTARVTFDKGTDEETAVAEATRLFERLNNESQLALEILIAQRQESESSRPTPSAPAPAPVASAPSGDGWAIGSKPKGAGTFRYLTSSAFSTDRLKQEVALALPSLGISPDDVDIYDDRTGKYGIETGGESYQPAKVKVKDGTRLSAAMQGKSIVAGVDFNPDGTIKVALSKDGRSAIQALTIADNLGSSI